MQNSKSATGRLDSTRRLTMESLERRQVLAAAIVSTSADDGGGSLRAAIQLANTNSNVDTIVFRGNVAGVNLKSALVYTGSQRLSVRAGGATIQPIEGASGTV